MSNLICAVRVIEFPSYKVSQVDNRGNLVVFEGGSEVPFNIARVFLVQAPAGAMRGRHAHKKCTQLLVCSNGCIKVTCDDGADKSTHIIDSPNAGLLVPEGIWSEQVYEKADSILTVLCNRKYEEPDYIRDYEDFLAYKRLEEQK
ncbi:MAG: FdtA/QdtA family cupin domain-containing protein [Verrucomicrobiota bacterium]|nr:FdtA/QdtA family cupin domain-containing protein [Verrucomicrobiota bacterium]